MVAAVARYAQTELVDDESAHHGVDVRGGDLHSCFNFCREFFRETKRINKAAYAELNEQGRDGSPFKRRIPIQTRLGAGALLQPLDL